MFVKSQSAFFFFFKLYCWLHWVFVAARRLFSSCSERGLLFVAVHGLLIAVAFLCCRARALGLRASGAVAHRLSSCGSRAQLLHGMWDLPGPGLTPVSPALAGGFLTTAPPGKSSVCFRSLYSSTLIKSSRVYNGL